MLQVKSPTPQPPWQTPKEHAFASPAECRRAAGVAAGVVTGNVPGNGAGNGANATASEMMFGMLGAGGSIATERRVHALEKGILFLKQQHKEILAGLHKEIESLKYENKGIYMYIHQSIFRRIHRISSAYSPTQKLHFFPLAILYSFPNVAS